MAHRVRPVLVGEPIGPEGLEALVARVTYRPGWRLQLTRPTLVDGRALFEDQLGPAAHALTLLVHAQVVNTWDPAHYRQAMAHGAGARRPRDRGPARYLAGPGDPSAAATELEVQLVPGPPTGEVIHRHPVPPYVLAGGYTDAAEWLLRTLQAVEAHEAAEWFRVDGAMVANPHAAPGGQEPYRGAILPELLEQARG